MDSRPLRGCSGCDEVDDLPRHVIGTVNKTTDGGDGQSSWHWKCHAVLGCTSCVEQLQSAGDRTGDELFSWLSELRTARDG